MKSRIILIACLYLIAVQGWSQDRYFTKTGSIGFYSHTPVEDIVAENHHVTSIHDIKTGDYVFAVLIKSFEFKKSLMEEHFNENYMESEKFPKSTFEGRITNITEIDFSVPGTYTVNVTGNLTIKDKTNPIESTGTMKVQDDNTIKGESKFSIEVEDYGIDIPKIVREKIAKSIEITCDLMYEPYK